MGSPVASLKIIRVLIHLYPKDYQHEYEEEMLYTTQAMLEEAPSKLSRYTIIARLLKDYVASLLSQHVNQFEYTIRRRPSYIRWSSFLGTLLVVPYVVICAYNLTEQTVLHRPIPIMHWEAHTWALYRIVLPTTACLIVLAAAAIHAYKVLRGENRAADLPHDAILLSVPLTLITTIAFL